ncbi:hypothetical protein NC796_04395 [Aliifodinibius sp. S!AR15-10]|uniref:hypothetical protein n=1 Tax=Aliifodinibius sp. S!AR15-10 TaxID=2950437 RepID=UPI0028574247|nr:hypothetical protein [Aliifodinibius sp. S!AR15-10]MDR8390369.1 hypothetical protein [Aliifodinibius sp. S!AR15-10]
MQLLIAASDKFQHIPRILESMAAGTYCIEATTYNSDTLRNGLFTSELAVE